jgi:glutathione S-transferase
MITPSVRFVERLESLSPKKEIHYERVLVDLRKKEQKRKEFLKLNPYGKVPVLIDSDAVIYESSVINEYIHEKYPNPPLMPSDLVGRARVRIWVDFFEFHFHTPWFNIYREMTFQPEKERNWELIEKSKNEIKEHLSRLNGELQGHEYLAGSYSLADIAFTPRVALFDPLGIRIDSEFKNTRNWVERIKSRPSYKTLEL